LRGPLGMRRPLECAIRTITVDGIHSTQARSMNWRTPRIRRTREQLYNHYLVERIIGLQHSLWRSDFRPLLSWNLGSQNLLESDHKHLQLLVIIRPAVDGPANLPDFLVLDVTIHFPHIPLHRLELIEEVYRRQPRPTTITVLIRRIFEKLKKKIRPIEKTPISGLRD